MAFIVILEDDTELAFDLTDLLETRGHEVFWARGASEALEVLKERKVDLVISDIFIYQKHEIATDGGVSLIGAMRSPLQEDTKSMLSIPIIAMSGAVNKTGHRTILNVARSLGAHRVLNKPFSDKDMMSLVDELLAPEFDANQQ
ncbi:MAG: response regulator [Litoreibacter sp.]|nr:response regulator [Litoreibacter sp.]